MSITRTWWLVALFLGALVCASTGCATSNQQQQSQVAHADGDQPEIGGPDDDELVCRREHRTGTHVSKKVCYNKAQQEKHAEDRRERDQQMLRDSQRFGCRGMQC